MKNSIPMLIVIFGNMVLGIAVLILSVFAGSWLALGVNLIAAVLCVVLFSHFKKIKLYV